MTAKSRGQIQAKSLRAQSLLTAGSAATQVIGDT